MILNYLKLAIRLLVRNPFFTFINISCLSVGIAMFYLLWQYAQFELKSDQFHRDYERIFRIGLFVRHDENTERTIGAGSPEIHRRLAEDFQEVDEMVRIINQENFRWGLIPYHDGEIVMATLDNKAQKIAFRESKVAYADSNVFSFFNLPLESGSPGEVLKRPHSIVLSARSARKYFGNADAIGKIMSINDSIGLTITGVFKDLPHNTHLDFDMLISMGTIGNGIFTLDGNNRGGHCYFKLRAGSSAHSLEEKLNRSVPKYWAEICRLTGCDPSNIRIFLQPITEVAFSLFHVDYFAPKSKVTLILFAVLAIVIFLMALVNYMNLTLSFNHRRMKEFAARKTLGAKSKDLIAQFAIESVLINSISILLAFTLIQLIRKPVEIMLAFYIPDLKDTSLQSLSIVAICIVAGIIVTGVYPAILTHKQSPKSLFASFSSAANNNTFGRMLTIFQYVSATVLIVWTFVIIQQMKFMLEKDLGLNTNGVIVVDLPLGLKYSATSLQHFSNLLQGNKDVVDFAVSRSVAGDNPVRDAGLKSDQGANTWEGGGNTNGGIDERFLPFYGIKLLAGRNFLPNNPTDERGILVDMNAIAFLNLTDPQDAIGRDVWMQDQWPHNFWYPVKIIGVIETFSLRPLSQRLFINTMDKEANVLTFKNLRKADAPRKMSVRVNIGALDKTLTDVEQSFKASFPGHVFHWYTLDEHIKRHYTRDKHVRNQIIFIAGLAIAIACFGLLGMMANQVTLKTKEIGIRKILGASLQELGSVLLRSTVYHLTLAVLIALPVAHFLIEEHLKNFIQRITLYWWHYAIPVVALGFILLITIATMLLKAVKTNPVDSLRYE